MPRKSSVKIIQPEYEILQTREQLMYEVDDEFIEGVDD